MTARDRILARLSTSEAALPAGPTPRPPMPPGSLADIFMAQLARPGIAATVDRIATLADAPLAAARYLAVYPDIAGLYVPPDPALAALDWTGVARADAVAIDGGGAIAIATSAVAETGTLVLDTAAHAPMLPNFLALHHIVIVEAARIVAWLEDVPPPATWPRARCWVTGVSGTSDIEGQHVRGAHGPRYLHVLLID